MTRSSTPFVLAIALIGLLASTTLAAANPGPAAFVPTPVRRDAYADSFNPTDIVLKPVAKVAAAAAVGAGLTNAQRLARGLPPRSPYLNTRRRALAARQSATPCAYSQPTGVVHVASADGTISGYLSRTPNAYGEYGVTTDASQALSIAIQRCDSPTGPFEITALNGALTPYPYVGAVEGFANTNDNLGPSSYNYAYIAGTSSVPAGPAQHVPNAFSAAAGVNKGAESIIWTLDESDASNVALVPTWTNTDGTAASVQVVYVPGAAALALVGDVAQFSANFGSATPVSLKFITSVAVPS